MLQVAPWRKRPVENARRPNAFRAVPQLTRLSSVGRCVWSSGSCRVACRDPVCTRFSLCECTCGEAQQLASKRRKAYPFARAVCSWTPEPQP